MSTSSRKEAEAERSNKLVPGLVIFSLGGALAYFGFNFGFKKQMKLAIEEMSDHPSPQLADPVAAGNNARSLAVKALVRGSAVAALMAMTAGVALSFVVEAHHKGHSKEQQDKEMNEIWRLTGLDDKVNTDNKDNKDGNHSKD